MTDEMPINKPEFAPPAPEIAPAPETRPSIEAIPVPPVETPAPGETLAPRAPVQPTAPASMKDPTTQAVEKILEEDLGDLYVKLDPQTRQKVKAEGDVLVGKLRIMVDGVRVHARKVLHLIRDWLKIIPGINKYFLEQEAKIKTDKILDLAEGEKQKKQGSI
jgi:hypothetical protein